MIFPDFMVDRIGSLAMICCKPRQARKGAAAAADSCAGVWLVRLATLFILIIAPASEPLHGGVGRGLFSSAI